MKEDKKKKKSASASEAFVETGEREREKGECDGIGQASERAMGSDGRSQRARADLFSRTSAAFGVGVRVGKREEA